MNRRQFLPMNDLIFSANNSKDNFASNFNFKLLSFCLTKSGHRNPDAPNFAPKALWEADHD